jgi:hypothetical protein
MACYKESFTLLFLTFYILMGKPKWISSCGRKDNIKPDVKGLWNNGKFCALYLSGSEQESVARFLRDALLILKFQNGWECD